MEYVVMISFVDHSLIEPRTARIFADVEAAKQAAYDFIDRDRAWANERPDLATTPVYQVSPHELTTSTVQKGIYRVDLIEWVDERSTIVETAVVCPVDEG